MLGAASLSLFLCPVTPPHMLGAQLCFAAPFQRQGAVGEHLPVGRNGQDKTETLGQLQRGCCSLQISAWERRLLSSP